MKIRNNIIKQLKEQNIEFNLLQTEDNTNANSLISIVIEKWKKKFIDNRKAPYLDCYLWHIFSFGSTKSIEGEDAKKEYLNQWKTDVLIFNESQEYLIECIDTIPIIEMKDFVDDIYVAHPNMKWTYVIPHEFPAFGPFFSMG